jgi:acid phosphatase family membrane protein YuiD
LSRNTGEFAVYRSHTAAVTALAQGEALAKAFGQSLKGLAAVYGNVIIGFDKRPTSSERAETQGWLRRR